MTRFITIPTLITLWIIISGKLILLTSGGIESCLPKWNANMLMM